MRATPSQTDRVLRALRRGPVNPSQFLGLPGRPVCDGGKPVQRLGARIFALRERGHIIEARRESDGTATYKLLFDADGQRPLGSHTPDASGSAPESAPTHDPLDHAHRQTCDWCAEHYADLAADAADELAGDDEP